VGRRAPSLPGDASEGGRACGAVCKELGCARRPAGMQGQHALRSRVVPRFLGRAGLARSCALQGRAEEDALCGCRFMQSARGRSRCCVKR